jgi:hypothetical protein
MGRTHVHVFCHGLWMDYQRASKNYWTSAEARPVTELRLGHLTIKLGLSAIAVA